MARTAALPFGIRFIVGFHVVSFVLWLFGQSLAVVAYDAVAAWGLQDSRDLIDPVIVQVNRAIGLADTIVMLPLFLVAAVGLARRRFYGAVASWLVFGMSMYWPVVFWCSQLFYAEGSIRHQATSASFVIVPGVVLAIAVWGSRYLVRQRELMLRVRE